MVPEHYKNRAKEFDASDTLAQYSTHFSQSESIYLDGNSLGKLPLKSVDLIHNIVRHQRGSKGG